MIKFFVMDVDGTLTDGKIYMGEQGELMKAFNIKDGYAIKCILPEHNIVPIIITARNSMIVKNRCDELDIKECHLSISNKLDALKEIIDKYNNAEQTFFTLANVLYVGDDIPDLQCMVKVKEAGGITACPADAVQLILNTATIVCKKNGGEGVVREITEHIIKDL